MGQAEAAQGKPGRHGAGRAVHSSRSGTRQPLSTQSTLGQCWADRDDAGQAEAAATWRGVGRGSGRGRLVRDEAARASRHQATGAGQRAQCEWHKAAGTGRPVRGQRARAAHAAQAGSAHGGPRQAARVGGRGERPAKVAMVGGVYERLGRQGDY